MSTFFRGPVCGTDNCRSRLWRIIDGRRTCQYGHVMEGDVEYNDDEDDINSMGVVTRRLNLTTNATGSFRSSMNSQSQNSQKLNEFTKVYGEEADRLFLKCFQHILKLQCGWLVKSQNFPPIFQEVVKTMWMRLLKSLEQNDSQDLETQNETSSARHDYSQTRARLGLSLLSSLALLYTAGVHLKLPAFWPDYLRWVCSMKLVYFKANLQLPSSWRKSLPNYYLQVLEGGKAPTAAQFYHKLSETHTRIETHTHFNVSITTEPLILKLLLALRLPPHLSFYTLELMRLTEARNDFNEFKIPKHRRIRDLKLHEYMEPITAAYVILALRFKLLELNQFLNNYCTVWLRLSNLGTSDDLLTTTSYGLSSPGSWDQKSTDKYLQWMESQFLPVSTRMESDSQSLDQRIANRKLHAMFPSPKQSLLPSDNESNSEKTFTDQVQDAYLSVCDGMQHLPSDQEVTSENAQVLASRVEARLVTWVSQHWALSEQQLNGCLHHLLSAKARQAA
ncbi:LAFA_0B03202g1_1 [Lachancea sp. 'fantastica']|nr:LAFA_0B03202g1_1 [Lachancea sp. 'fantastica']